MVQHQEMLPELLRAITEKNPNVFSGVSCSPQPPHWNHAAHTSPLRHTPQGSPASPASACLPSQPPATTATRPTVITEQQKPLAYNSDLTYLISDLKPNNEPHKVSDSNSVISNSLSANSLVVDALALVTPNSDSQFSNVNVSSANDVQCAELLPAEQPTVTIDSLQEQLVTSTNIRGMRVRCSYVYSVLFWTDQLSYNQVSLVRVVFILNNI